jgi:hypothetical protein
VQRPSIPLVRFIQINCDLHGHRVWHLYYPRQRHSREHRSQAQQIVRQKICRH